MSPYQRGCRDALLDAAAQLDKQAGVYDDAAKKTRSGRGYNDHDPVHFGMYMRELGQAQTLRAARDLCRSLAERCPDDPEEPTK